MAEIKTGIFAKNVQKRLNRAQEKVREAVEQPEGWRRWRRRLEEAGGLQLLTAVVVNSVILD